METSAIGLAAAFAAGMVSFLSPCVLPLVPGYVSYVAGDALYQARSSAGLRERAPALALSAVFVLGFSTVFVALGAGASVLGDLLQRYRNEANVAGGVIVLLFGLAMLGMLRRDSWFYRDFRFHPHLRGGRPLAALLLGLAFGFGWTPCIGPVLGTILTMSAAQGGRGGGLVLLSAYALGLGVPFIASAFFTHELIGRMKALRSAGRWLQLVAGVLMIAMGLAMITGQLSRFGFWLLDAFPAFGRIG